MSNPNIETPLVSRALHWWIVLTAGMTLVLVGAGGLVTSHGAGMSVPDWPNTYGYNMFFFPFSRWIGGIFYEHTHRLIASTVGLMTTVMAIWFFGRKARSFLRWAGLAFMAIGGLTWVMVPAHWSDAVVSLATGMASLTASFCWPRTEAAPKWLRVLGLTAFFAVVLQGVLGGLRVILFQAQIGIFHATLAQFFFALICALAVLTGKWWARYRQATQASCSPASGEARPPHRLFLAVTVLILLQLILGATMRHQHAGLAIPDFPLAYGKLWPATDPASIASYNQHRLEVIAVNPITAFQVILQMIHRLMAVVILAAVAGCAWLSRRLSAREKPIKTLAFTWLGLVLVQVGLGAATIWSNKAADIATVHVMIGALLLALGSIVSIVSGHIYVRVGQEIVPRHAPAAAAPVPLNPRPSPAPST